jgi:hypothetical protein
VCGISTSFISKQYAFLSGISDLLIIMHNAQKTKGGVEAKLHKHNLDTGWKFG